MADVGAATASEIIEKLRDTIATEGLTEASQAKKALMNILKETIGEGEPLKLDTTPSVILVIGVNGVGKTTTIAKIANNLIRKKKKVMLAAGDTFRAGAIEQLQIWADRVGADIVVFPENESGVRLAKNLLSSGFVDMITLSKDFSMVELDVRPEWIGKNLMELNLRKKHAINVVAIKRAGRLEVNIDPMEKLSQDSSLIVIANPQKLAKLK